MASLKSLDPSLRQDAEDFVAWLRSQGVQATVTSARRSLAEQTKLYNAYIAGRSQYPAARPGSSKHELGIAFDLHLNPPVYQQAGVAWEQYAGGTWGGRFKDPIHFERGGPTITQAVRRGAPDEPGLGHQDPIGTVVKTIVAPWWSGFIADPITDWFDKHGF